MLIVMLIIGAGAFPEQSTDHFSRQTVKVVPENETATINSWFMLQRALSSYGARGKFGEHGRSVRVARGDSRKQLYILECSPNFPSETITRIRTAKSMNQFFYNLARTTWALKHVLYLIDHNQFSRCTAKENKALYYPNTTQSVKQQLNENA